MKYIILKRTKKNYEKVFTRVKETSRIQIKSGDALIEIDEECGNSSASEAHISISKLSRGKTVSLAVGDLLKLIELEGKENGYEKISSTHDKVTVRISKSRSRERSGC